MQTQSFARALLDYWGVPVTPLPEGDREQSDFLARFGRSRFLIEEKTKEEDANRTAERRQKIIAGQLHVEGRPFVRTNRMSGLIRKAASQLASSASQQAHEFRLVWLTGTGPFAQAHYEQFMASLYGTTRIVELNSPDLRLCYFFRNSDFYRYAATLDGAVAAYLRDGKLSAKLCLNPLSARSESLARTKFARLFKTAVTNPRRDERRGRAYILDSTTDRANEGLLLAELQAQYKTGPLMPFDIGLTTIAVGVRGEV